MKRYLITLFFITQIFAKHTYLPVAMEIMEEVEVLYQDERVDEYLERIIAERELPDSTLDQITVEVEEFFESDMFLETGAAYLTSLFSERELMEVLQAIENYGIDFHEANNRATKKLQRLLQKLDPYLYKYVKRRVVRR